MEGPYRYRAFISYSHRDEYWATWLHRAIETYRVPKRLVGRDSAHGPIPARLAPVFRDRDELPTATNLGETLSRALAESQFQLVICSTAAARSHWVNEEILTFKRLGREDRIFCLLVDGEPGASLVPGMGATECFPPALLYTLGADGNLTTTRSEPIAADVRPKKDGKPNARLKLVAGMLGVGLDVLKRREAQRQRQKMAVLGTASTIGMVITSGLAAAAWVARNEAERQRARAQQEAETARQTTQFMVDLFKVSDPGEALGNTITAREILDKGAARVHTELSAQPAIQATLMDTMGTVYTSLGLYDVAVPMMQQALEKRRGLGGDEEAVAASLNNLGGTLTLKADYKAAEGKLREALDLRRKLHGADSAEVAESLSALADLLSAQGDPAKATPLIEEALKIRLALHGERHPLVAESIADLGQNLGERGEFGKAEEQLRHALELQRQLRPEGHPALTDATNNLAWALMNLDRPAEAETLFRDALAMRRKVLGTAHPDLAIALNNLAYARETRGDYAGAEAAYLEALAMRRKLLGERHPGIATNMSNLAFVQYANGKHKQAIDQLRTALAMRRDLLGPKHPDVAGSAASLAYWLIDTGEWREAEALVNESLAIRRQQLGDKHPSVATTLSVKASLLLAERRYQAAADLAAEAEAILKPVREPSHWQMAMAMNVHGAALAGLGQYAASEKLLLDSLPGLKGAPIPGLADKGRQHLQQLYVKWGRPEQAKLFAQR